MAMSMPKKSLFIYAHIPAHHFAVGSFGQEIGEKGEKVFDLYG
jgi:hypothetical protein